MELNDYQKQLDAVAVAQGEHRNFVGGLWDQMGRWQFDFMTEQGGLQPDMRFLDLGCGCFRGGVYFIPHLRPGNYYGLDSNESLIRAGMEIELPQAGLQDSLDWEHVLVHGQFDASSFGVQFDRILALSVWTHLPLNHILLCLWQMARVLQPGGIFYSSVFKVDAPQDFWSAQEQGMGVHSYAYQDPYHYPLEVLDNLLLEFRLPFKLKQLGTCGHPRLQVMLELTRI